MDGLTKIIAKIENQNSEECNAVLEDAKVKSKAILDEAKSCAEKEALSVSSAAQKKIDVINSKALSSADLEYKRVLLAKKSELIESVIKNALDNISNSKDEVYFDYIKTLILSNALVGKGELKMSKKDFERLPAGFVDLVNNELPDGKSIECSVETFECSGGVVIDYPEIRVDCTFSSLAEDKADEIRDEINRVLFS